jgi:hypothetical protein
MGVFAQRLEYAVHCIFGGLCRNLQHHMTFAELVQLHPLPLGEGTGCPLDGF